MDVDDEALRSELESELPSRITSLERAVVKLAALEFGSPDQARDEGGRWTDVGGMGPQETRNAMAAAGIGKGDRVSVKEGGHRATGVLSDISKSRMENAGYSVNLSDGRIHAGKLADLEAIKKTNSAVTEKDQRPRTLVHAEAESVEEFNNGVLDSP